MALRSLAGRVLRKLGIPVPAAAPFRRDIAQEAAATFAAELSRTFDSTAIAAADVQRVAALLRDVEARIKGRIAGDVEDHVLNYFMVRESARRLASTGDGASDRPAAHGEIGTLFGGSLVLSLFALKEAGSNDRMLAVDPLAGYYGQGTDPLTGLAVDRPTVEENLTRFGIASDRFRIIQALSQDAAALEAARSHRFLSLWIDGDHSHDGLKRDWLEYTPHVVVGGHVLIDNYRDKAWPGVTAFIDDDLRLHLEGWEIALVAYRSILFRRTASAA